MRKDDHKKREERELELTRAVMAIRLFWKLDRSGLPCLPATPKRAQGNDGESRPCPSNRSEWSEVENAACSREFPMAACYSKRAPEDSS